MEELISGFGFCSCDGHRKVKIFKVENGFIVEIDYTRSKVISGLDKVWEAVEEVEALRKIVLDIPKNCDKVEVS